MNTIDFEDFFEPEEADECEFDVIDPTLAVQFTELLDIADIERLQKNVFNFDKKESIEIYGEKAIRDLEFQIQTKRILQIFDEMIAKLEILLCLQEILKQDELMMQNFSRNDIESLRRVSTADAESLVIDDSTKRLIRVLLNSNNMHAHVDSIKDNISFLKKMFLTSIRELRNIIDLRLQLTAPKELKKEQILHNMWKKYEKTKEKIGILREKWIYRKQNFEEKMQDKYETIERYKREIKELRKENEVKIEYQLRKSNTEIVQFCKIKEEKIVKKHEVTEEAKEMYKQFLNENLSKEQKLREHKNKAIQALQATLSRYDEEVGNERTRELQDLRDAFDMQKSEFALWKETVNEPHIKLHEELMFEKEENERKEMEKAMMIFMMNRSARILQKHWRNLVAKRKKKKGRRGAKKK